MNSVHSSNNNIWNIDESNKNLSKDYDDDNSGRIVWSGPSTLLLSDVHTSPTDIVLIVEGRQYPLHKRLLSDKSPVLRSLFTADTADRHKHVIELKGIGRRGFELLLQYCYFNQLTVTSLDVIDVLMVTDYLQVEELQSFCFTFLVDHICIANAVPAYQLAVLHNKDYLMQEAAQFICSHVDKLQGDLNELSLKDFNSVIFFRNFKTLVLPYHKIYNAIVQWTRFDSRNREHYFADFKDVINFRLFPSSKLKYYLADSLFTDIQKRYGIESIMKSLLNERNDIISLYPKSQEEALRYGKQRDTLLIEVQNNNYRRCLRSVSSCSSSVSCVGRLTFNCTVDNRTHRPLTIGNLGRWSCSEQEYDAIDWNLTATCGDSGRLRFRLTYLRQCNFTLSVGYVLVLKLSKFDGTSADFADEISFKIHVNRRRVNIQTTSVDHFMLWDDILNPLNGFVNDQHKLKVHLYLKRFRRPVKRHSQC